MMTLYLAELFVPLALILWIALYPARNRLGFFCEVLAALLLSLTLLFTGMWLIAPWWTPLLFIGLTIVASLSALQRRRKFESLLPTTGRGWLRPIVFSMVILLCLSVLLPALRGRLAPQNTIALEYPLESGRYHIVSGGNHGSINSHFMTLNASEPRFKRWRGQSYALDIIGVNAWGLRAAGILPEDPSSYFVYGKRVLSPCQGTVTSVVNDVVDNRVPQMNRDSMSGNHVILRCEGVEVVLAHMIPNSIRVAAQDSVAIGDYLGRVGNSGNSGEPHLHIHVQRIATGEDPLDSDPLPLEVAGRYWVRNQIMVVP